MATIDLNIDPSKSTEPLRDLADQLEIINKEAKETGDTFEKSFSKSTNAVNETTKAVDDQTKAIKNEEDAIDALKKGVDEFAKENKKGFDDKPIEESTKAIKKQRGTIQQLERDIKATEIRRRRANDPNIIAGLNDKLEQQKKELRDIGKLSGKALDGLSPDIDEFGKKASGVFSELKDDISSIGQGLASSGPGGIVGGFQSILGKIGPVGMAIGGLVAGAALIGVELFAVDQKFDKLRGTVESLFGTFGDETDEIVVNIEAIAQTFDEDVNEVLLATNTLAKEFNLSGKEASEFLAAGFNSAANAQGDLIDSVKEFSSQIRASGGDASDLFSILERSNKEGIFSDKGIDVVKEFGLRIREQTSATSDALEAGFGKEFTENLLKGIDEGSISSIEALGLVTEELGGLQESSKEAQTIIADVFGGAGEDAGFRFLTQLKDINEQEDFRNKTLSVQQQRTKDTLEANERLASAQNELSKAIGDSSAVGRIWTGIQTGFVNVITTIVNGVNEMIDSFSSLEKVFVFFVNLVSPVKIFGKEITKLTLEQRKSVAIQIEAAEAIKEFRAEVGKEALAVSQLTRTLGDANVPREEQINHVLALKEQYPELLSQYTEENLQQRDLVDVKKELNIAFTEEFINRRKVLAIKNLDIEADRQQKIIDKLKEGEVKEQAIRDLNFLKATGLDKIDAVEEELKIQLGLLKRSNEDILEEEKDASKNRANGADDAAKKRLEIEADFKKAIAELIKKGDSAFLSDQTVSATERLERQKQAQLDELDALLDFINEQNEILTGGAELDIEVIEAFNRAQEKIVLEFNDRIRAIERVKNQKILAANLKQRQELFKQEQESFNITKEFLQSQLDEELAIIEQNERKKGESERQFEIRKQQDILDTQQFFLDQKALLIDQELQLKLAALDEELLAIAEKEGAEFDLKRINLERKKELIEQETQVQKEQFEAQSIAFQNQLDELAGTDSTTLGDVFSGIGESLSDALNLSPEQIGAIVSAVQQVATEVFNTIQESTQDQLAANDELITRLQEREQEVKDSLEREVEFAKLGYAANVQGKRNELAQIEEAEEQANIRRQEILRQQEALDTISQGTSLITASANLYKSLSVLPFGIGIAVATALTAVMFGAFASSKAKARSITQLEKGGSGTTTGLVTGKRHSQGGENFLDHVEVENGEMWSMYNRKGSKKYHKLIDEFTNAVNTDDIKSFMPNQEVPDIIVKKSNQVKGDEIALQAFMMSDDIKKSLGDIPKIKDAIVKKFSEPKREYIKDGKNTYLFETFQNGSKKRTKIKLDD